jgi:hypothetical protein
VDTAKLTSTVEAALEAAKESGEFNGPEGPKGDKGDQGEPGTAGSDGLTPRFALIGESGGTRVVITTGSNEQEFFIRDGEDGAAGPKGDTGATGPEGPKGDKGDTGPSGSDGLTPRFAVIGESGGTRVKITTGSNEQEFFIRDGKTPVKGTDYFTAADKAEMVTQVKDALTTETWTFTLEDGSTVTKVVYVG